LEVHISVLFFGILEGDFGGNYGWGVLGEGTVGVVVGCRVGTVGVVVGCRVGTVGVVVGYRGIVPGLEASRM
jgi:hypothetical protein